MDIPQNLLYTDTHEWVRRETDDTIIIGISAHAQHLLGDLVFVDLPEIGKAVQSGEELAVLESVKAASDLYAPLDGEVIAVNTALQDTPELINQAPYGDGWIVKLKISEPQALETLLNDEAYTALIETA